MNPALAMQKILPSGLVRLKCPVVQTFVLFSVYTFSMAVSPVLLPCWILYPPPHLTSLPASTNKHDLTSSTQAHSSVLFPLWLDCNSIFQLIKPESLELSLTPYFLSNSHPMHQQNLLVLLSKYIQNPIVFFCLHCYILIQSSLAWILQTSCLISLLLPMAHDNPFYTE